MTWSNNRGEELIHHDGPRDGQEFNVFAPIEPGDDDYVVRTDDDGMILGAWYLER